MKSSILCLLVLCSTAQAQTFDTTKGIATYRDAGVVKSDSAILIRVSIRRGYWQDYALFLKSCGLIPLKRKISFYGK